MDKKSLKKYRDLVINCVDFKIVNSTTLGMLNALDHMHCVAKV